MKKGSFILAVFIVAEFIFVLKFNTAFPASIIEWSGVFIWEMLIYWTVHIAGLFIIAQVFFLECTVNYKHLLSVLLTILIFRVLYDFWIYEYLEGKTFKFFFELSKISFFAEIAMQLFVLALLSISAYLKKYRFVFKLKNVLIVVMVIVISIICVRWNLYMINGLSELDMITSEHTVSTLNVVTAFGDNLLCEKIITYFSFLAVFLNLKKSEALF